MVLPIFLVLHNQYDEGDEDALSPLSESGINRVINNRGLRLLWKEADAVKVRQTPETLTLIQMSSPLFPGH